MTVDTSGGAVDVRAAYAGSCSISTAGGEVSVGSLHADSSNIAVQAGALSIESGVDGELHATSTTGDLDVHLGNSARSVRLESTQGNINLTAPADTLVADPIEFHAGVAVEVDPVTIHSLFTHYWLGGPYL